LLLELIPLIGLSAGLFLVVRGVLAPRVPPEELAVEQVRGFSGERVSVGWQPADSGPVSLRGRVARLFRPMAERAERRAAKKGRATLDERLNRADLKISAPEFMLIRFGCLLLPGGIGLLRFGLGWQVLALGVAGYAAPGLWLRYRQRKRLNRFNSQLANVLLLLANSMRAGQSFPQAIGSVAERGPVPTNIEFGRVVREINLGGSVDEGLANMVARVGSADLELVVTAVAINRSAGGNLAEMLEIISTTIRQRVQTKQEIKALTAQGRASGWFITALPVGLSALLYLISPTYFRPMTQRPAGWVLLGIAGALLLIGNFLVRKAVTIEV
jgi:tight adherence protein B